MTTQEKQDGLTKKQREDWFCSMWQPDQWARNAENLWQAANILFSIYEKSYGGEGELPSPEDMEMDVPATLLYGFAIENAIKGLLIKKQGLNESTCQVVKGWKKHDLVLLFKEAGTSMSDEEKRLLDALTPHIWWAGRYPATFKADGKKGFFLPEQYEHGEMTKDMPPRTFDGMMRYKLDPLFKRVLNEITDNSVQVSPHDSCQRIQTK